MLYIAFSGKRALQRHARRGGGVLDLRDVLDFMHGSSRKTIDPRIPTIPGLSLSGFHRPGGGLTGNISENVPDGAATPVVA